MSIVVVDSKWAWAVPIGGFIANILLGGFAKSFGIIISEFEALFSAPTAYFTLAGGLIYTFMYTLSLPAHLVSEKIGVRPIIFCGGIGSCVSIVCAAYSTGIVMWLICIGVGLGVFLSMIHAPVFITVGRAFERQMGKANGLSVAGVSIGQIVFPYIVTAIIEQYTVRGSCIIGGGLFLHFLLAGALMPRHLVATEAEMEKMLQAKLQKRRQKAVLKSLDSENGQIPSVDFEHATTEPKPNGESSRNMSNRNSVTRHQVEDHNNATKSIQKRASRGLHRTLFSVFVVLKVLADVADIALAIVLPVFARQDCNFSASQISLALSIAGGVDLLTRLLVGFISDRPGVKRSAILLAAYVLEAFAAFLFTFSGSSYPLFVVAYGLFGASSGTAVTLMVVVLSDFVTPKNLPRAFAIMMLVLGLFIGAGQYVIGLLKDLTGNFQCSLLLCGFLFVAACCLMVLEYPIRWWFTRWETKELSHLANGKLDSHELDHLNFESAELKEVQEGEVEIFDDLVAVDASRSTHALERSLSALSRATSADLVHSKESI